MSQQSDVKKRKFRNWMRGGLAYKYLKQGLEGFADDVVKQDHKRILSAINYTPGNICTRCSIERLRPIHSCIINSAGKNECHFSQLKCNCLQTKKEKCRFQVCDFIMEEIFKSHGSTPPTPNWTNTDIQKWCTEPWEVAKCFISAPGYSDKTKAADIDISGLLHVFINNTNLHCHLASSMTGTNVFIKVRERRNKLFHSATMEMEDGEVVECIDDIVEIFEDPKQLKGRHDAQKAVNRLKQLKESKFKVTTNHEVDVCEEALRFVSHKLDELNQMNDEKQEVQYDIDQDTVKAEENKQTWVDDSVQGLDEHSEMLYERVRHVKKEIPEEVGTLKTDISGKVGKLENVVSERVGKLETDMSALKSNGSSVKEQVTSLKSKVRELDSKRQIYKRHLDYVKGKQELQVELVKYYQRYYVKTSLSPLKQHQDCINVKDVYVPPEIEVIEEDKSVDRVEDTAMTPDKRYENGYYELFQTNGQRHKKIYIVGDVGTGKSTFCKMMIENWCNAVTGTPEGSICDENAHERKEFVFSDTNMVNRCEDVSQMQNYEFLFFIPLQYMTAFKSDVTVDMIKELTKEHSSNMELIDKIFQEDSERCLIIVDSLDEWSCPEDIEREPHISYGIPNGDLAKDATVITLSRPSAKGIINLKNSDVDHKLQFLGISSKSLKLFIERYISEISRVSTKTYDEFIDIMVSEQIEQIEKRPFLLQQLLWLYCNDEDLGGSISETYTQMLNAMCGWSNHRNDGHKSESDNLLLPTIMQQYPKFEGKERVLFLCGKTAFDILCSGSLRNILNRQNLLKSGLSNIDVNELTQFGILNEINCFNTTEKDKHYAFAHMSFLEFFAAVYVTTNDTKTKPNSFQEKEDDRNQKVLDTLFGTCVSASDILQLSNVIKMVCGLSPVLIGDLSKLISCIMNKDKHILHLRKNGSKEISGKDEITLIQRLITIDCLKECGFDNNTMVSVSDLFVGFSEPVLPLQSINPDDVISLTFDYIDDRDINAYWKYIAEYLRQCKQLQYMHIRYSSLKHIKVLLSHQLPIKHLALYNAPFNGFACDINLSKQNSIQTLELSSSKLKISELSIEQLEQVHIQSCWYIFDIKRLSNAGRLTELYVKDFVGDLTSLPSVIQQAPLRQLTLDTVDCTHNVRQTATMSLSLKLAHIKKSCSDFRHHLYIDLSKHNHLQNIRLVRCPCIDITGLNTEQLEQVYIDKRVNVLVNSERKTYTDPQLMSATDTRASVLEFHLSSNISKLIALHLDCVTVNIGSLVLLLQQAPLRQLTLMYVSDNRPIVRGRIHVIDLSKQNQLRALIMKYSGQLKISQMNTEQLEQVHIKHCPGILESDIFLNAHRLTELSLQGESDNKFQYNERVGNVVHTLHQLRKLALGYVNIEENALTVTSEMKRLTHIVLEEACMSRNTWCTFVDSLVTLHQSVEVKAQEEKCYYVNVNPMFEVIRHSAMSFTFKSKIQ